MHFTGSFPAAACHIQFIRQSGDIVLSSSLNVLQQHLIASFGSTMYVVTLLRAVAVSHSLPLALPGDQYRNPQPDDERCNMREGGRYDHYATHILAS